MTIKIHNKKLNLDKHNSIVLFVNSNLDLKELNNSFLENFSSLIKRSIKLNKNKITKFKDFFNFDLNPLIKLIIIKNPKSHILSNDNEKLGASFFNFIKTNSFQEISFIDTNLKLHCQSNKNFFNEFLSGILIKSYEFDKYNDDFMIEIKSRRINHDAYNTLFFGYNKFKKADDILKKCPLMRIFYIWNCNDKIVGWEHRSSDFEIRKRGRYDRGKQEIDICVDIKQKYIKPLKNLLEE